MAYTPVELRHVQLKRGLHGYRKDAVDQLLIDVAQSFEDVWRERADLADKVEELEKDLVHHRERESALNNALVSAEKSAAEARELAQSQADLVVAEAHAEARSIVRTATGDRRAAPGRRAPDPVALPLGARDRRGGAGAGRRRAEGRRDVAETGGH